MKKIIVLLLTILILLPINVKAIGISQASISNKGKTVVDNYFDYKVNINFNDLDKNKDIGIWFVAFEIEYDDTVFATAGVSAPGFNSTIYIQDGKYYVLSEVIEKPSNNNCKSGLLFCSNYSVNISFYTYQTTLTNSEIKVNELEVVTLDMTDSTKEYTLNDANILTSTVTGNTNISIKPSVEKIVERKVESIATTNVPKVSNIQVPSQNNQVVNNPTPQTTNTTTTTSQNTTTENKLGNIDPKEKELKEVYSNKEKDDNDINLFNFKMNKQIMKYGVIILGIIVLIIILVVIINKIRDNKVNKELKNFDKF